jgi:phosphoglycerol transferase MdoB-like AlkP superfamily enzyme
MTENLITYAIVILVAILSIFAFTIGIEKMIRIILGNYILSSICLAAGQSINLAVETMKKTPELTFMGFGYTKVANFLDNGSMTIILILYIILLIVIFRTSKIRISLPDDEALKKMLQIIFVPLTVISMVLTLQIAILGMNGINITAISSVANAVANNPYMFQFVSLTPVRILIHGIVTILITSEFKVRVQTDL